MDWPDMGGRGAHFDKRFRDEYRNAPWDHLTHTYGWYSVAWFAAAVWFDHLGKGGDG